MIYNIVKNLEHKNIKIHKNGIQQIQCDNKSFQNRSAELGAQPTIGGEKKDPEEGRAGQRPVEEGARLCLGYVTKIFISLFVYLSKLTFPGVQAQGSIQPVCLFVI